MEILEGWKCVIFTDGGEDFNLNGEPKKNFGCVVDAELRAIKFAKKTGGQLYTQVDCEGDRNTYNWAYVKGNAWVNRTGAYMVLFQFPIKRSKENGKN